MFLRKLRFRTPKDGRGSMQQRGYSNVQRPCCPLPCEFHKNGIFVKHRFCLICPPSMAVLSKNSPSKEAHS